MADEITVEVDIERFCHSYSPRLLLAHSRRRQSDLDPERIKDRQGFSDLAGFLAVFEIDDEAYSGCGCQGEILLRDADALAGVPNQFADLRGSVGHGWPKNITVQEYCSRPKGNIQLNFPYGNLFLLDLFGRPDIRISTSQIRTRQPLPRRGTRWHQRS